MNRRKFIKQAGVLAPLVVAFSPLSAAQTSYLESLVAQGDYSGRILVLIHLNGGNDSLNTFIPVKQYNILAAARKNIIIPENRILKLNDTDSLGFHPSMSGLQKLYNDKKISIIQGVGYPDSSLSHQRATNIKLSAEISRGGDFKTGWIGRFLESEYPDHYRTRAGSENGGPPCMRIGYISSKISQAVVGDMGLGIDAVDYYRLSAPALPLGSAQSGAAGFRLEAIRAASSHFDLYASRLSSASDGDQIFKKLPALESEAADYPKQGKNKLANQLKIVSKLIKANFKSRVYVVSQDGYDTHSGQADAADTTRGKHAALLADLSEAITTFQDDLQQMGRQDDVLGMTFSEFGRRICSNDSYGTDHGTSDSVLLFGTKLKKGIWGTAPELPPIPSVDDNLPFHTDFRSVYASVLKGWFGVSEDRLKTIIQEVKPERLDLFVS